MYGNRLSSDEGQAAAVHDERVLRLVARLECVAEHAPVLLVRALDVLEPPRRPEPLAQPSAPVRRALVESLLEAAA